MPKTEEPAIDAQAFPKAALHPRQSDSFDQSIDVDGSFVVDCLELI